MSYHILHVLTHGALLARNHGHLVLRPPKNAEDARERTLPLEDLRAVVIAARGVTLTSNAISGILEHDGIILHCDERYQPAGVTAPLPRVTDLRAFRNQLKQPKKLNETIWHHLLVGKTVNQQRVLQERDLFSAHLERAVMQKQVDESNCARHYWQLYFPAIGWGGTIRDRKADTAPNRMLNYGYTVLAALCHRSLLVHGLSPQIGVHHLPRFRNEPLVYDLMEPYRPFVDQILAEFMAEPDISEPAWCRRIGTELRDRRVHHPRYSLKLLDAVDKSATSLASCYAEMKADMLWVPEVEIAATE